MARKNLLQGLMSQAPAEPEDTANALPRYERGAIGAVSKSIDDLKRRAIIDVLPDMIDNAGLKDRLDEDPEGLAVLTESIREYGQQVPVLLRHSPNSEGRYDVVYGRRRVAALKALRQPVKAMVRTLDDRELVIAQGQENSARKDLSFIEKALFAQQMVKAGYERKIVCDALSIDKTVISRMLTVAESLPHRLILEIGSAPSVGRDRWLTLVQRARGADLAALQRSAQGAGSDQRFEAVFAAAAPARPASKGPRKLTGDGGETLGEARAAKNKLVIELSGQGREFGDWLADHLHEVHRNWLKSNS
ncbi:plasmid partitioning protein RepB [Paracoccus lutimaris]|uniref:ParB family chromosome partitioning protein n=1 Tax=Paracoccus lutimaris TaxID=1490030 RepID=A0A368YF91_9RHOB|nr:plasmid partitioning protein RepB [Paracoccus lutimaris]RCW78913.1 ParB family chromosome partitioning protein [Paracoccus lutimaris]